MAVRIRKRALDEIDRHAVEAYPEECCGVVLASDGVEEVRRITNVQNDLHDRDPEHYPRDARTAYFMEPGELEKCLREVDAGRSIRLFYHSHPDHGAYFSAEDKAAATPFGEPSYPDACYLVVSVRDGRVDRRLLVTWDTAKEDFVEIPLVVEEDERS
jgi:proteasome lid subunit RPN8/RPN11